MEREMDQFTVLKRNHLFNLPLDASQHEGDLHARSFFSASLPLPPRFLSSSSVSAHVKSPPFVMDFLLADFLFTIRGCF